MREISLEEPVLRLPRNTFLIYGASRSGKTTFAATFPRPLFFSDVTEGGWDSIANMDAEQLFEPGVKPIVWGIEKMTDMVEAREKATPLIASGRVQTIVTDSLSFYCDLILNCILMTQSKKDTRAAYGDLGNHLRDMRAKTHMLPVNVVWLCLDSLEDDGSGGPMIPGKQAAKFMAGVHYIFYARVYQEKRGSGFLPAVFEMRTRTYAGHIAGNRLGGRSAQLPDPLIGSYQDLISSLGYDPVELRKRLPAIASVVKLVAKPVAKPPIVAAKPVITRVVSTNVVPTK